MKIKNTQTPNYQKLENTGTKPEEKPRNSPWLFRTFVIRPLLYVKSFFTHGERAEKSPVIVRKTGNRLGVGGGGTVEKAELNGRKVAQKIMHSSHEDIKEVYGYCQDENAVLAELDHPHIVKNVGMEKSGMVVSVDEQELDANLETASAENAEYIAVKSVNTHEHSALFELADSSLDKMISTLPGNRKNHALHLLSAVSYLHDKNYCHLDIKPANVLWSKDKGVQLCDFNTAVKVDSTRRLPPDVKDLMCTLAYGAPELLEESGESPLMPYACDSWNLGCTLAEMITRERIFSTSDFFDEDNFPKDRSEIPYEERVQEYLAKHEETLGRDICEILRGMLEVNPEKRLDVKEALARFPIYFPD